MNMHQQGRVLAILFGLAIVVVCILVGCFIVDTVNAQELSSEGIMVEKPPEELIPYPPRNPACVNGEHKLPHQNGWSLIFYLPQHHYCPLTSPNGDYWLFGCTIEYKDGHKLLLEDVCTYASSIRVYPSIVFLPIVQRETVQTSPADPR